MKTNPLQLVVGGREVFGAFWVPECMPDPCPIVVFGHGLTDDSSSPFHSPVAEVLAKRFGILGVALDAPGHGARKPHDRASAEEIWLAYREEWRADQGARFAKEIAAATVAVARIVGAETGPLAYWGLSLGTQYGLSFLARSDRRINAAVLGLFGAGPLVCRYAAQVRCPVVFLLQEQDELHSKQSAESLFESIASDEKHLITNRGQHAAVPADSIRRAIDFVARKLCEPAERELACAEKARGTGMKECE